MFNLTRLEQQAIVFLTCSLLIGGIVHLIRADLGTPSIREYETLTGPVDSSGVITQDTLALTVADPEKDRGSKVVGLNSATARDLQSLPGIGPKLAQRIVTYRSTNGPFRSIKDLDKVKGIGPMVLARLTPLLSLL